MNPDFGPPPPWLPASPNPFWTARRTRLAVALLLTAQALIACHSTLCENMTIDEPLHVAAGVSYWQTGNFRAYWHSPPLLRLVQALPVVLSRPTTEGLYARPGWDLVQADLGHRFASANGPRFFALCQLARIAMPAFLTLGGLLVFRWSRRLWGNGGGVTSLALYAFCPNLLAHGRLATTDVGAAVLGLGATLGFLAGLRNPSLRRAAFAGSLLGVACLAKFTNLLLFGLWPLIFLVMASAEPRDRWRRITAGTGRGLLTLAVAVLVIDAGYLFRGVGQPLGRFDFLSRTLTAPRPERGGGRIPTTFNDLHQRVYQTRVNRFRDSILASIPVPLPREFVLGFDEQKFEAEGVEKRLFQPNAKPGEIIGYPVYLDGELRDSGWWDYYLRALLYKVPEPTLLLWALTILVTFRIRTPRHEEFALWLLALTPLTIMTVGTDINIGLRYVLAMFLPLFILCGKLAPALEEIRSRAGRQWASAGLLAAVVGAAASSLWVHPHYLAYFNAASGGPVRGSEHLIDSNLDWGQDLVNLADWVDAHAKDQGPIGLAYFGQIHPNLLAARGSGRGLDWFLPPARDGKLGRISGRVTKPGESLRPGLYAVSASLVRGLAWRLYDPEPAEIMPAWRAEKHAYSYFSQFEPIATVGHSIFIYRLTAADVARWPKLRVPPRE